jgi:hypothetical protein
VGKLTIVQVTKLLLYNKLLKIGMICFAKPILTEDWCSAKGRIFNNVLYVRTVRLLAQGLSSKTYISGRESQGSWRQDELIGGKASVIK